MGDYRFVDFPSNLSLDMHASAGARMRLGMKTRQFKQVANQPKDRYFELLAEGLEAIAINCRSLDASATSLFEDRRWQAAELLHRLAEEEAGKFLVLLDAVRLGRADQPRQARQLNRAGEHLAKGLYAVAAGIRPDRYAELLAFLESRRQDLYLDGPNDADWIFRNEVLHGREELLYVDLVDAEGELIWFSPSRFDTVGVSGTPSAVSLVLALAASHLHLPPGLRIVESVWAGFVPNPSTRYQILAERIDETVEQLVANDLLTADFSSVHHRIVRESWPFPLHHADLAPIPVDESELRQQREAVLRSAMGLDLEP
jgi:AbiV family abortive infection protein